MSNLYNNNGISTFSIVSTDALFIAGKRFKDYITEIQTELDFEAGEIELLKAFADRIDISGLTGTLILNDQNRNQILKQAIEAIQSEQTTQNNNITALQNKTSYWNSDGTIYNNGGNDPTEIYASHVQIADIPIDNFIKIGVEGNVGIRVESVNDELVEVAPHIIIRAQDTTQTSEIIDIGLGYGNTANNGKTEINIGSGQSTINIGSKQASSSIADGNTIIIGNKQNVNADSDIRIRGNFHSEDCQMVTLDVTNNITWGTLLAQAAFIPFLPGLILSSIFGPTVQFSYSDLMHLTSSKFMETTNSPNLNGISVFDASITSTVFPAINFLSLWGSITSWTGNGNIENTSLFGEVLQKVGDNSTSTYNYTKVKTNGIDIYSKADTINLISNGNGMVKILNGNDLLLHNTSDGNGKYIHIKDKLKITNGNISPPYTTEITDALVASYASLFTVGNITNVNSTKLTFDNVNSSTTTNALYRDANSNLFWNGRNISNYTAGTASTYIFSITSNVTTPPAVGTLNLTYTSTPLYYINYTGYAVATELEVGTFTSPNIDLIANPFISSGLWSFNYHTTLTANVEVRSYFKVYVQETVTATNTSTTTLLKDGSTNYVLLTPSGTLGTYALTYNELYIPYYQFPNLTTCTYKIIIKAYIYQPSGTTSHQCRFGFNDTALSHVHTTFQNVSSTSTLQNVLLAGNTCGNTPINMNGQAIQNASDILPQANNDLVVGSKATSTGKTYIYANAAPKITATSAGVGIGTTTAPAYPLDVGGDINLTGNLKINGVTQSFGGTQTLAQVLTQGNTANTSINMNSNNITGANTITASTFTGGSGGKIVCHPSSDETTIGKFLNPLDAGGYSLYTQSIKCNGAITAAGFYLGNEIYKPLEWDWQGVTKATSSSTYFVKWDSVLESLPIMSLAYDWELELRFSNYLTAYSYIGLLLNGDTATNEQVKNSHWGHEFQMWANTSAVQVFTTNIAFSKCFPKNNDYNDFIYRLRLCWDSRNNVLVNYVQGVCYRWYNGLTTGATDYETSHGVQVIHNTAYLTESGGETPSINSIRFQSWTTTQDLFRRATLKIKRVAKRWS